MTDPSADHRHEDRTGPIDLSVVPPFRLGSLEVRPPTREVRDPQGGLHVLQPRVMQVLVALSQARGAVISRDVLVARCWEGRIVGDDAIHRAVAKARLLADLATPPAFVIEAIPRVGYRLLEAGSSSADAAPTSSSDVAGADTPPRDGVSRRALAAGGAALVVAGAGAYAGLGRLLRRAPSDPLVAVLPFDNLSPDPQMGYFADGLSEDILNALIRGGGVRVTSRTSSFTFRGPAKGKAADALKADYLLDGSVLREGGRLRVNAHLTDVAREQTLWSQTYDRDVGQGLQIEDEIAGKVAAALKVQFAMAGPAAQAIDPVAYDLYLRGRDATRVHTPESLKQGNDLLRSAVAQAPNFAAAWYALAKNYWRSGFLEPILEQQRGFELGRQAAERAISLDPRSAAAFGVITQMIPPFGHWREIDAGLARGLSIAPNDPDLLLWRCAFLLQTGRLQAAVQWARRAQAVDPFELAINHRLNQALTFAGNLAEAEVVAARIAAIWPDQLAAYWDRFWTFVAAGRDSDAEAMLGDVGRRPRGESEEFAVLLQAIRTPRDAPAAARAAAGRALLALARQGVGYASNSIVMLARLGAFDEALDLARSLYLSRGSIVVERSVEFRGNSRFPLHGEAEAVYLFHPFLAPPRRAGKLQEIFDGIGLTAFWRTAAGPDA